MDKMKQPVRKILVIVGSDSDLPQSAAGLEALLGFEERGVVELQGVLTMSVHRNTLALFHELDALARASVERVDVIVAGAGWAAHLPGMIDAYLRYTCRDSHIVVVGVAFEDEDNPRHTEAAELSISEVPGTQVVYADAEGQFVGEEGFRRACVMAAEGGLPVPALPKHRDTHHRSTREVLATFGR